MKPRCLIFCLALLLAFSACHTPTHEAKRMVARAERLADTLPDSTIYLIDSVLRMPVNFSERRRMDMALLQGEVLFRDAALDDDFSEVLERTATSPELERAANYYAKKKQYNKVAHAALYSGYVQQHYNEKETAMQSFKDAEHYGGLVGDSLTMARAEYHMGQMLYSDYLEAEALILLKTADLCFGNRYTDKALTQNLMASCCILLKDYENAENHLQLSLEYAEKEHSSAAKTKALNNCAVLNRQKGEYNKALSYLKQAEAIADAESKPIVYMNMATVFLAQEKMDSTSLYLQKVNKTLSVVEVKKETLASIYSVFALFSENKGDYPTAYQYRNHCDQILIDVMEIREQKSIYRIQQQYDYNVLKETMDKKVIHRQRIILFLSIVAALILVALSISQIRLARIRKQEAEIKASLFNFMQQNQELERKNAEQEKDRMELTQRQLERDEAFQDLEQKQEESENARYDLAQKLEKYKNAYEDCAHKLSDAWIREQRTMQKLAVYLDNEEDAALLGSLRQTVFGNHEYWEAMTKAFDKRFPGVRKKLMQQQDLTDNEQKILLLSYIDTSREDTALLLHISIHMVDKLRNSVRKKMQEKTPEKLG